MNLFDIDQSKWRKASDAMDKINDRYGEFVIVPAIMMGMQDTGIDRIAIARVKELEDLYAM
jgi:DNA polymerase-4